MASITLLVLILTAWIREGFFREWKKYQMEYVELVTGMESFSGAEMVQTREVYPVSYTHLTLPTSDLV